MNKNQLIDAVAETAGLGRPEAGRAVESMLLTIRKAMENGEDVRLAGFGTFTVSRRKASIGRNPRTGEALELKASASAKFKAGKTLKDALN